VVLERALRGAVAAVGATRAGLFMNLMPVFGAVLAVVLLRESLAAHHLAGAALVLGGITLGSIRGRGPR
jgi:drug/metabolite transporter (DMT)-like permease